MAKSKRSKVKMAHRAMRRAVMEPKLDQKLRERASKVYKAIGLEMPPERPEEAKFRPRSYGGSEVVSTFTPTPDSLKLNSVHGPLANRRSTSIEVDVIGLPIAGAGKKARANSGRKGGFSSRMDVDDEEYTQANTPYFYPRRRKEKGGIRKRRRESKLKAGVVKAVAMEVDK